ncbi:peptidase associated/transthyretin-like domain-containing protein [Aquimarina pacifica]|uniref:carboxypeptidase-like regulatory domain-containing protein n=1 Tax=Aquimarina pacifica TaxID=1296415 RepID=UPI00046FC927|nr:carboxypeptidase-like regulatory domain-containing protein [Aquimarina pacifica]
MKIKLSLLFVCFFVSISFAQITSRVMVEGKISAPIGDNVEGVVVYNRSTDKGTITNKEGWFKINAGINDRIEVVAMQYQHFIILVDKGVVDSKRLHIFLHETVNQLEEVVVTPYDLLGNVTADVGKIDVSVGGLNEVEDETSSIVNDIHYDFTQDNLSFLENKVLLEDRMINGLNFVNLFKAAYKTKKSKKKKNATDIDVRIRDVYDDQFFKDYLALEINQINDFIFFAESNGLNKSYFNEGKELDLLQFLVFQSNLFLKEH